METFEDLLKKSDSMNSGCRIKYGMTEKEGERWRKMA